MAPPPSDYEHWQKAILDLLATRGPLTNKGIAAEMGYHYSTISKQTAQMRDEGVIVDGIEGWTRVEKAGPAAQADRKERQEERKAREERKEQKELDAPSVALALAKQDDAEWGEPKAQQQPNSQQQQQQQQPMGSLIEDIEQYIIDKMLLSDSRYVLPLALWTALTYVWQSSQCGFTAVPYIDFVGFKGSGKNHAIHTLGSLSYRFKFVARGTEASLRDIVNGLHPTLGVAECERDLKKHNSYIHILFNSGYVPNEPFCKIVSGLPVFFDVYCPKMMATVGNVEETLHDRCIIVPMAKGTPKDTSDDFSRGRTLARRLHYHMVFATQAIMDIYHSKTALKRVELLMGRDWQIWKPLFAICAILMPDRMTELENCAGYLTGIKSRRLKSVKEMHQLSDDLKLVDNSKLLVKDAGLVAQEYTKGVKTKYIATTVLTAGLLALPHGYWQGYECPDAAGKRDVGIGDPDSGKMTLAKMLQLGSKGSISPPDVHNVQGKTIRGYSVAELIAAADALKKE